MTLIQLKNYFLEQSLSNILCHQKYLYFVRPQVRTFISHEKEEEGVRSPEQKRKKLYTREGTVNHIAITSSGKPNTPQYSQSHTQNTRQVKSVLHEAYN